jgi:hypothetical protein
MAMRQRCKNTKLWDFKYYGGRGIRICPRWDSVELFVSDMGKRPSPSHQLDRIDTNGDYSPDNCRWVEKYPQMQNTRISKRWFVGGVMYVSLNEAAKTFNTTPTRIKGWCEGRNDGGYSYPPRDACWSEKVYE